MRKIVIGISTIAFSALATGNVFAEVREPISGTQANAIRFERDATYGYDRKKGAGGIKVIYVSDMNDNERARFENALTPNKIAAAQASIDSSVAAQLRAKGINPRNVLAVERAFNGRNIYYIR